MATYREMVYMVLDMMKVSSDDSYYTEEHIIFALDQIRSLILSRKYGDASRSRSLAGAPDSDYQEICLDLQLSPGYDGICNTGEDEWLESIQEIPSLLPFSKTEIYPLNFMLSERFNIVPIERLPFTGTSKWLRKMIYAAKGPDDKLYIKGSNSQIKYLKKIKVRGIFANPSKALELSCDESGKTCDIMDAEFPIEGSLQAICVEMAVQELAGLRYTPQDRNNNAKDDLQGNGGNDRAPQTASEEDMQ